MRAPLVVRWPGHIKPGTVKNQMFAALDWLPTLVNIAGGPKGDALKKQIEAGQYPGIVKTTLDGVNQRDYLEGKVGQSARDNFFYYSGAAVGGALQELEDVLRDGVATDPAGFIMAYRPYHWTQIANIKRDPFETRSAIDHKTLMGFGGALAAPSTAYQYDWNILPIGQPLWLKELQTYKKFPPMQDPASYNLDQVLEQVKTRRWQPAGD